MASISWSSTSLLILLAFPFSATLISPLLGVIALPYFIAMASDLRYCGYKRLDVFRIYGFNLILLGVNLAGTLSSIVQGITASKAPFARTPKVRNRTVVAPFLLIAPYILIGLAGYTFYHAYVNHLRENLFYAALNVVLACYAVVAFIGLRNSLVDLWIHGTAPLYRSSGRRRRRSRLLKRQAEEPPTINRRAVLEPGYGEPQFQSTGGQAAGGWPAAHRSVAVPSARAASAAPAAPAAPSAPVPPVPPAGASLPGGPPKRRLSLVRVLVALIVLAGAGYGVYAGVKTRLLTPVTVTHQTWFAPYVDATLTPTYQFQSTSANPARQSVLGFVVAASSSGCTPSWGGAYTLAAAGQTLAMSARIAQLQQEGAQAIVSFGGQANTPLDVACPTAAALTSAYQSVISAYSLKAIDLDIEGAALNNAAAENRRAQAIASLEQSDPKLTVWLTLPVETNGLQDNALSVISSMLRNHVAIAGVNIMTMDFSSPPAAGSTMAASAEDALKATYGQLAGLYPQYGIHLSAQQIWQELGATPMIGQNDIQGEIFTVADAKTLVGFAAANHLGRLSMWSINRDSQCGTSFPETGLLSNTCSGTAQSGLQFAQTFSQLQGSAVVTPTGGKVQAVTPDTNPADAPYPQWTASAEYPLGYKVVENGEIYQAKWYNSATDPAAQVQSADDSPWELVGPVVPGDHGPSIPRLPAGTYPAWSLSPQYQVGDKVLFNGLPYQAKWSNQGVSPATQSTAPSGSPWKALYTIPGEPAGSPALG
jgi:chitinase